jgi:hypothetical protein
LVVKSDPKSINQAIQAATPEQMLELKKAEQNFELQMKELEVDVFKLEVARQTRCYEVRLVKTGRLVLLVLLLLVGLWVYIFLVTLQPPEQNS